MKTCSMSDKPVTFSLKKTSKMISWSSIVSKNGVTWGLSIPPAEAIFIPDCALLFSPVRHLFKMFCRKRGRLECVKRKSDSSTGCRPDPVTARSSPIADTQRELGGSPTRATELSIY